MYPVNLIENVALRKPTKQLSTRGSFVSSKAVDGDRISVSCTNPVETYKGAWWQVDLGDVYTIKEVVIVNIADSKTGELKGVAD